MRNENRGVMLSKCTKAPISTVLSFTGRYIIWRQTFRKSIEGNHLLSSLFQRSDFYRVSLMCYISNLYKIFVSAGDSNTV